MKSYLFAPALAAFLSFSLFTGTSSLAETLSIKGTQGSVLKGQTVSRFANPWAMTFLNDNQLLVTTKTGRLWVLDTTGQNRRAVRNVPKAKVGGQGGLGDVILHPDYAQNSMIYLSMVEAEGSFRGAVVYRAKLILKGKPRLAEISRIWTQTPKLSGKGHFSHRLAFGPKGSEHAGKLLITSGDRQEQSPAQKWDMALGKIIRLNHDGSVPADNPFQDKGELAKTYWTTGHRNPLGIAFDAQGRLWSSEMGPKHGDELNHIRKGQNYGWPIVSDGNNYNGSKIPAHKTRPEFATPAKSWVPSIAPAGLIIYSGDVFPAWKGDAFLAGLISKALIRVDLNGTKASEAERFEWGKRIREVEQGPDGAIWVLEDKDRARLLRLTP